MEPRRFIAYYRVSTARQGTSGLGLEAQRHAVRSFVNSHDELLDEFVEIESGKQNNRPHLNAALVACKRRGATLVIAKLDRLARNVHFVSGLLESGVSFVCCDMPEADRTFLQMAAVFAEWEGRKISERTKAALAAARDRGVKLGNPNGNPSGLANARRQQSEIANDRASTIMPIIEEIRRAGLTSYRQIAIALNARGIETARGKRWHASSVRNVLARAASPLALGCT